MKIKQLINREEGVIHHLGLIIFAVLIVGAVGFAVYQIQNQDPNFNVGQSSLDEEDLSQSELELPSDESDATVNESDEELMQVTSLTEESDAN